MPSRITRNLDELFGALKLLSEQQQQQSMQQQYQQQEQLQESASMRVIGVTTTTTSDNNTNNKYYLDSVVDNTTADGVTGSPTSVVTITDSSMAPPLGSSSATKNTTTTRVSSTNKGFTSNSTNGSSHKMLVRKGALLAASGKDTAPRMNTHSKKIPDFEVLTPSKTLERMRPPLPPPTSKSNSGSGSSKVSAGNFFSKGSPTLTRTRATITPLPTLDESTVDTDSLDVDSFEPIQLPTKKSGKKRVNRFKSFSRLASGKNTVSGATADIDAIDTINNDESAGADVAAASESSTDAETALGSEKSSNVITNSKVESLLKRATRDTDIGKEDEALNYYKKALAIYKAETARISKHLQQVQDKHPASVQSISGRLHEDWLQVGLGVAQIRMDMGKLYERLGDFPRAIACAQEAIQVYQKQDHLSKVRKNNNSITTATAQSKSDVASRYSQARELLNKLIISKGSFEDRRQLHDEVFMLRQELSSCVDAASRAVVYQKMERKAQSALKLETKILGSDHPLVADTTSLLGALALEQQKRDEAMEYLTQGLELTTLALGSSHPRTGQKLLQLGQIYNSAGGDPDLALQYYKQAADVYKATGNHTRLVGSTLNELSVMYIQRREYDQAIEVLKDALEAYDCLSDADVQVHDNSDVCADKVQIWRNLGEAYQLDRQMDSAVEALVKALDLQRDGRRAHDATLNKSDDSSDSKDVPSVTLVDDESIAETLRRLGKAYSIMSMHQHAIMLYKEALLIHQIAVKRAMMNGRTNSDLPCKQDQMAHTLFCLAEAHDAIEQNGDAMRLYSEALQLRLFSDSYRPNARTNMVHCAMCLFGIGGIHMKNAEWNDAIGVLKDAIEYCNAHGVPKEHQIFVMIIQRVEVAERNMVPHRVFANGDDHSDRDGPPSVSSSLSTSSKGTKESAAADEFSSTTTPPPPKQQLQHQVKSRNLMTPSSQTVHRIVNESVEPKILSVSTPKRDSQVSKPYKNIPVVSDNRDGPPSPTMSQSSDEDDSELAKKAYHLELHAEKQIYDGNLDDAVTTLSKVMSLRKEILRECRATGRKAHAEKSTTALTLVKFGQVLAMQGDNDNAKRAFHDSLKLYRKAGHTATSAPVLALMENLRQLNVQQ